MAAVVTLTLDLGASALTTRPTLTLGRNVKGSQAVIRITRVFVDTPSTPMLKLALSNEPGTPAENILATNLASGNDASTALFLLVPPAGGLHEYNTPLPLLFPSQNLDLGHTDMKFNVTDWNGNAVTYTRLVLQCSCVYTNSLPRLSTQSQNTKEVSGFSLGLIL